MDATLNHMSTTSAVSAWESEMEAVVDAWVTALDQLTITIEPLGHQLEAAVMATSEQKTSGMIGRVFDQFDAMLFVETEDSSRAFHNQGVTIPLLVAFFDHNGALLDQIRMDAQDGTPRRSGYPYRYALELPASWDDLPSDSRLRLVV